MPPNQPFVLSQSKHGPFGNAARGTPFGKLRAHGE